VASNFDTCTGQVDPEASPLPGLRRLALRAASEPRPLTATTRPAVRSIRNPPTLRY
jgi:hypothetical protein